jgi:uncharacterized membrane protein (DUF4010 family)
MMDTLEFILKLAISLAIGGLIGLEREQHREHELVVAGVRTYPLISMGGFLFAFIEMELGIPSVLLGLGVFGAIAIVYIFIRHSMKLTGFTSPVAILITYVIGVLVGYGHFVEAVAVGVATTFLLLAKGRLHELALAVTRAEMMGALQFILVAGILYPLTLTMDPVMVGGVNVLDIINLPSVILTVILVSLISFISFLAIHYIGSTKGLAFSGIMGGLVNSEAAAASLSSYVTKNPGLATHALAGILLANAGMLVRNIIISGISDTTLKVAMVLVVPAAVMGIVSVLYATWSERADRKESDHKLAIESPFGMRPAIILGSLIAFTSAMVYFLAKNPWAEASWGIYLMALVGFVSSGAVTFSVSALAFTGQISPLVAGEVATIACLISTLNKMIIIRSNSRELSDRSWKIVFGVFIAGLAAFVAVDIYLRTVLGWTG